MKNQSYVYALLDPRKPGPFRYGSWVFSHEPFYIGKGQGNRADFHHKYDLTYSDSFKTRKIKKIMATGQKPLVVYKKMCLSNMVALKLEIELIAIVGRGPSGPLTNMTDGGEGRLGSSVKHTEATKRKIGQSNKRARLRMSEDARKTYGQKIAEGLRAHYDKMGQPDKEAWKQSRRDGWIKVPKSRKAKLAKSQSEKLTNWWKTATPEQIAKRCTKSTPGKGKTVQFKGREYHFSELLRKFKSQVPYATAYARIFKYGWDVHKAIRL